MAVPLVRILYPIMFLILIFLEMIFQSRISGRRYNIGPVSPSASAHEWSWCHFTPLGKREILLAPFWNPFPGSFFLILIKPGTLPYKQASQQTWSGFSPTTVPDNSRQSGLSPKAVPEMSTGLYKNRVLYPGNARNQGRQPLPMCRLCTTHFSITIIGKIINIYIYLIIRMTLNFRSRWDI